MNIFLLPIVFFAINILLTVEVPKEIPKPITTPIPKKVFVAPPEDKEPWGVAKQIDSVTWQMKVGQDAQMGTPAEILIALNDYRRRYGASNLSWDSKLADYALSRAKYFRSIKNLDAHKGFADFLNNQDGFSKLGFNQLGENASYGYKLSGVHLIEWIYAGDEPHNKNQLNSIWNYVGIGVDGVATALIFGTGKL
ncbi:CAP domain-containing protein [Candidatus Amesbacteria bacterium]|nr:CAP domain-containing protein [Candidatus Amesbacteria bacterium]